MVITQAILLLGCRNLHFLRRLSSAGPQWGPENVEKKRVRLRLAVIVITQAILLLGCRNLHFLRRLSSAGPQWGPENVEKKEKKRVRLRVSPSPVLAARTTCTATRRTLPLLRATGVHAAADGPPDLRAGRGDRGRRGDVGVPEVRPVQVPERGRGDGRGPGQPRQCLHGVLRGAHAVVGDREGPGPDRWRARRSDGGRATPSKRETRINIRQPTPPPKGWAT